MARMLVVLVGILTLPLYVASFHNNYYLQYDKVHLVDVAENEGGPTNYLFRGNMPKNTSQVFAYNELLQYMSKRAASHSIDLPTSNIYLYVISLNSLYNINDTKIEQKFFQQHPDLGTFENWSFYHRYTDPSGLSPEQIKSALSQPDFWGNDDIPNRVQKLRQLLYTPRDKPVIFYFHCETGCDRTGELGGAYYMSYLNMTYAEAIDVDTKDCGRPPNPAAAFAVDWYCYYLVYFANGNGTDLQCSTSNKGRGVDAVPARYSVDFQDGDQDPELVYVAVFIPPEAADALMLVYQPLYPKWYTSHMTLYFKPPPNMIPNFPWGVDVNLTVVGYGFDTKAQAVVVSPNPTVKSEDAITHITISTQQGVPPVYSNEMLAKGYTKVVDGIVIWGRVGGFLTNKSVVYQYPW